MNHIDLFSGIGGFAYAAQQVWGSEYHNVFFCDNNDFCQSLLRKNFGKDIVIYGDIRDITTDSASKRCNKREQENNRSEENEKPNGFTEKIEKRIDLLTGGFPCQPFSQAGKRKGTTDDRYLWPEMLRVIRDFKPTWIIAENVRGLLTIEGGLVFEQVCLDLEREDYEVQTFIIPAVAVNAPHRRDRVWIVANLKSVGFGGFSSKECSLPERKFLKEEQTRCPLWGESERCHSNDTDTGNKGLEGWVIKEGLGYSGQFNREWCDQRGSWQQNWITIAQRFCKLDDGVSNRLVTLPNGTKISYAKWRIESLKALGNSIVSQVAIEIMKAIKIAENA